MVQVKDLTRLTLSDLWHEVKEDFWEEVNEETQRLVRRLLEESLEAEMIAHLQVTWYQRQPQRRGYRNGYRLRDVRPAHIQAAYATFARRDGRGPSLSPKTIFERHALLRQALGWAVRWQLLARNPTDAVSSARPERGEMHSLDREEALRLLDAARPTRHYPLLYLALTTGARLGELLALRWQDVHLDRGVMEITRTARFFSGKGIIFGQPKTHRSRRPVALSPDTVRVLREQRRRLLEERLMVGAAYAGHDLVFADPVGRPIYDSTVRRAFYAIMRTAGLAHVRIHDLRHTAATLMLRAGVNPKVVSERLGHATVSITLDTYSHVLPDLQREAAEAMDAILVGNSSAKGRP